MANVLVPLPDRDFDPTEVAVPWRLLTQAGHEVTFCTERGDRTPSADPRLLDGVIFGKLGARPQPLAFYRELERDERFRRPCPWVEVEARDFDGLLLPGGHAPGMRQYLGSLSLRPLVAAFFASGRPVGAICHGVLVAARTTDPATGRSVLHQRRTTCLPKYHELLAYALTSWKLGRYYRTYPRYVQDEVKDALRDPGSQFERGPVTLTARDSETDSGPAFVVPDGTYLSARWPGDAYTFARRFGELLDSPPAREREH